MRRRIEQCEASGHLDRFFFAVRPPSSLASRIAAFGEVLGGNAPRVSAERLHVTVAVSDDFEGYPAEFVEILLRVGGRVASSPFRIALDRLLSGNRAVFLVPTAKCPELKAVYQTIADGMASARAPLRQGVGFNPHMTLFYRDHARLDFPVPRLEWTASELLLIRSLVGLTRHETLATWPLTPREPDQHSLF